MKRILFKVISLLLVLVFFFTGTALADTLLEARVYFLPPISNSIRQKDIDNDISLADYIYFEGHSLDIPEKSILIDSDDLKINKKNYKAIWKDDFDKNEELAIQVYVDGISELGLDPILIGSTDFTIKKKTDGVPIPFYVINNPEIRVRQLHLDGESSVNIASAVREEFGTDLDLMNQLLMNDAFTVDEISKVIKEVYIKNAFDTAGILKVLGYSPSAIAGSMKVIFEQNEGETASILKALGYFATTIATTLKAVYNIGAAYVGAILKSIGFAVDQIALGLELAYEIGAQAVTDIMFTLEFASEEVLAALYFVYVDIFPEVGAMLLSIAGYAADAIVRALDSVYEILMVDIAKILKDLEYSPTSVADAISHYYGIAEDVCAVIMKAAGYTIDEIAFAISVTANPAPFRAIAIAFSPTLNPNFKASVITSILNSSCLSVRATAPSAN